MKDKDIKIITDATQLGLQPLTEYANRVCWPYKDVDLLNSKTYSVDDTVNLKGAYTRLMDIKDYTAIVEVKKEEKKFTVRPELGGVGIGKGINEIRFNNRTNQASATSYEILIKKANSTKTTLAKFNQNNMYDIKEFKKETGCFCSFSEKEALEFIKQKSEEANEKIDEYANTGKINFEKNDWLWGNAAFQIIATCLSYIVLHGHKRNHFYQPTNELFLFFQVHVLQILMLICEYWVEVALILPLM